MGTITADSIIQQSSGTFNYTGTPGAATLPNATAAGSTVVIVLGSAGAAAGLADFVSQGFALLKKQSLVQPTLGAWAKPQPSGGETSWTITPPNNQCVCWHVYEIEGLDQINALDVVVAAVATGTGATLSTGTTAKASTFEGVVISAHVALDTSAGGPAPSWSGHTGGLTERLDQGGSDGTRGVGLSTATFLPAWSLATWSCTATKTAPVGMNALALILVLSAAGAKRAADPRLVYGAEQGTSAGLATGAVGANPCGPLDEMTAGVTVTNADAHTGSYCQELDSTGGAAARNWRWLANGARALMTPGQDVDVWAWKFPGGSLPAVDVQLEALEPSGAGTGIVIRFITATGKIGFKIGTGTEQVSDQAVTADTWFCVGRRVDGRATTYLGDWQICYAPGQSWVDQTQATMAGATIATSIWHQRFGWTNSIAVKARVDTIVVSDVGGHYPLGPYDIRAVTVDTSGSAVLSGTSTNWQTTADNGGSFVAWNAATALTALGEYPPAPGAAATVVVQIATATGDYVEVPLTTIDAATTVHGALRGVRAYFMLWAATTLAAQLGCRAHDGTTEHNLSGGALDYGQDNSTTTPAWFTRMVRGATRQDWTQAAQAALTLRFGYASDANPKIGCIGMLCEAAYRIGDIITIIGPDPYGGKLEQRLDPDTSGIISFIGTAAPDRDYLLTWDILGVPQTPVTVVAADVHEEVLGATDIATITAYGFNPV